MPSFFEPSPQDRKVLDDLIAKIPAEVQHNLTANHPLLTKPDRGAHQQQLAGSKVLLTIADTLPAELDGLGVFQRGQTPAVPQVGIGRMSTGLGCPHAETDPDFLGLMVAFLSPAGRRVDFITINDPTSPTDTPEEFVALLQATADAAGASGLFATQATLLLSLARHAGLRAPAISLHVTQQTSRTVRSRSAYQPYWTGIVRARETLGKFTFVPTTELPPGHDIGRGPKHLTEDWKKRQSEGDLAFALYWIPFISERETPLGDLTTAWREDHKVAVGTVTFPKTDPTTRASKLTALLASELGANPGNWDETSQGDRSVLPATRFTAARSLAYRASQQTRHALPDAQYQSFFERGELSRDLAAELVRRYEEKRSAGHWVPDLGDLPAA